MKNFNITKILIVGICLMAISACNKTSKGIDIMQDEENVSAYKSENVSEDVNVSEEETNIFEAVRRGKLKDVKNLINKGADVNSKEENASLLSWAVIKNDIEMVKLLIENGADVNIQNHPPINIAISFGSIEIVKLLIEKGANVNAKDNWNKTPLMLAAEEGHLEIVKILLNAGADVNETDAEGSSALIKAANYDFFSTDEDEEMKKEDIIAEDKNRAEIAKVLIAAGADVNVVDEYQHTALYYAVRNGNEDMVKALLDVGADIKKDGEIALVTACNTGNPDIADMLVKAGVKDTLHAAAARGDLDSVKSFIENGVNVNIKNESFPKNTPLHYAAAFGRTEVVKYLIEKGANINIINEKGNTPLLNACGTNADNLENVRLLLKAGAKVNIKNKTKETPLILAACNGQAGISELLIEKRAKINETTDSGTTALMCAAYYNYPEVIKVLVKKGANINQRKEWCGYTALMIAAKSGKIEAVKALLEGGVDKNIKDYDHGSEGCKGFTALIFAIDKGYIDIAKLLIESGADVNIKNKDGATAISYAINENNAEVVKMLLDAGADPNTIFVVIPHELHVGDPILVESIGNNRKEITKLLLDAGADVNARGEREGETALMLAAAKGDEALVKRLLKAGADVDIRNRFTLRTAFDYADYNKNIKELLRTAKKDTLGQACERLDVEAVKKLIKAGADVNALEKFREIYFRPHLDYGLPRMRGYSPLHVVKNEAKAYTKEDKAKQEEIIKLLTDAGAKDLVEQINEIEDTYQE